ncbi:PTS sugar transporter subunit IIB [Maledivibacter halophilus]|uniref:PTS system lichenan oligosaccharide-specific IIB component, Lac family (TC 4.A.3.2.2) n=1 Tax=Maledivibacter halophilus TaxID=36842 RepID=A0A1T5KD27_9FIRM|nr:PTS sugar transporter subunit IIB [Maledivibacter halophilus]SKC61355.1 PTS system lichenan oligosaccharide-specific IIB component, Lac family (TC 4.A.3.2.2) [Maledivibacter halophilus]
MNILLVCSSAMSTSLMVSRMEKIAKAEGKEYKIWAIPEGDIHEHMDDADVILLAPQVRFLKNKIQSKCKGKPVGVIEIVDYGSCNGANVLKLAEEMCNK